MIGASVWIASTTLYDEVSEPIERRIAETTPTAIESSLPNGLPIAATGSPGRTRDESPSGTVTSGCAAGSTLSSATSSYPSQPTIFALTRSPSLKAMKTSCASLGCADSTSVTTCALVRM